MRVLLAALLLLVPGVASARCGPEAGPCVLPGGEYHAVLPEGWQDGGPAVVHLHGFGGSGGGEAGKASIAGVATGRGYALIAPSGIPWREKEPNPTDWAVRDGTAFPRDDLAFLLAVLDDAAARFGIDRSRILLTGFSRGGSMVWDVACLAPEAAAAYAPVAGGFWEPMQETCAGPVKLLHTHGFSDRVVPLEGRRILWEGLDVTQGDIHAGLAVWRDAMGCDDRADDHLIEGDRWHKTWACEADGAALELVLHPGGHGVPKGWMDMALDWFERQMAWETAR